MFRYRFYLPEDPDIEKMKEMCEKYKKRVEIKKEIRLIREKENEY